MARQRICIVTGSRAEYGLLYWIMHDLHAMPEVELQIVVTGMHLAPAFGLTVRDIEADGFAIARRVSMLLADDSADGVCRSIGLGVIGMSEALAALQPDVVVVLGDRFEILAASQACLIHRIPLAHLAGGDVTEGAFDDSIRHAITKMAHLHLVSNEESARRVRQMGEDPARVHVVGSPGLDHLRRRPLLDRATLEGMLGAPLGVRNLLVTFHPVTLADDGGLGEFDELLAALDEQPGDTVIWFTRPNADPGSSAITQHLDRWVEGHAGHVHVHTSLGQLRYLSLMALVDGVVGNSSSGLYEAPSFAVPAVDIGERQRGRLAAASVLRCASRRADISAAIRCAMAMDCSGVLNPYGDGATAGRVIALLRSLPPRSDLLRKPFHWTTA